jgi:4-hydroxy-tetrahydrodipicolinate synthase
MAIAIQGIVPVIPTPFTDQEAIDVPTLRAAVEFAVSRKMAAICLPAYGSEFYKLNEGERELVVTTAIDTCGGRVPVIAQANHPSTKIAADVARRYEQLGADVISFALPRQFGATDDDLLNFCGRIAEAVSCPVLVQDFNPTGLTVSAEFIAKASQRHSNITYFKLEEPMILDKLVKIRNKLGSQVHLLGGWGGYFMLESLAGGMCGFMPGLALCDLLDRVYCAAQTGDQQSAYDLFSSVLPYITFSLQDFEMFLHIEKRVLVRRGIFVSARCRALTRTISAEVSRHADYLIAQIIRILDAEGLRLGIS